MVARVGLGAGAPGCNLPSSLRPLVGAAVPRPVRRRRAVARAQPYQSWLTPEAHALTERGLGFRDHCRGPSLVAGLPARVSSERGLRLGTEAQAALCASRGGSFEAPLLCPTFWPLWRGAADR